MNTGEGGKGRTVSDDAGHLMGGKSLSDTSTSAGVKSTAIRTSVNIFEASKRDKPQYFVDKVWKLTNTVRVGLDARSSHAQRQSTFPDNVCSYCPPCHGVSHYENLTTFLFF